MQSLHHPDWHPHISHLHKVRPQLHHYISISFERRNLTQVYIVYKLNHEVWFSDKHNNDGMHKSTTTVIYREIKVGLQTYDNCYKLVPRLIRKEGFRWELNP